MSTRVLKSDSRAGSMMLVTGLLLALFSPLALGAQDMDSRWLPWLGCWEAIGEVQNPGEAMDTGAEVPMVCIAPLEDGQGVRMQTWSMGEVISTETIRTDGMPREVTREGCTGIQEGQFSDDGERVYLRSSFVCEGGHEREATGLVAMLNPVQWMDVKVVEVEGNKVPLVLRYRMAPASRVQSADVENVVAPRAMAVKAARIEASAPLTIEDLLEATGKVDPEAVQALMVERGDRLGVDADALIRMADAGVPESVIDVAVATNYPEKFTLDAGAPEEVVEEQQAMARDYYPGYGGWYSPRWSFWDPFYRGYYGYGMGYSPYSYGLYGGGFGWYRPTPVVVDFRPTGSSGGRVIKGRGYVPRGSSSPSGRTGVRRAAPPTRSSGAAASSGGRTSGGTKSSGRKAKRRGGGGGGI